jgi:DNA-binding NarL/FixJ family response regulator
MPDTSTDVRGVPPAKLVARLEAAAYSPFDLATLWSDLAHGCSKIVDTFHTEHRCYVILQSTGYPDPRLTARKLQILERVLLGEGQKVVASDLHLAVSTVAFTASECLRAMGLEGRTAGVPSVLLMAAHAFRGDTAFRDARVTELDHNGMRYRIVSAARPDLRLGTELTPTECVVARLLVEGKDYEEIALLRRKSLRTVANQLSATFHKLGVSGRSELLHRLIRPPTIQ